MPIITTLFFCEEASPNPQTGKLTVSGPLNVFAPAFIPGMFSFALVLGIRGVDLTKNSHRIRLIMSGTDDTVIDTNDMVIDKQENAEAKLPPEYRGLFINMDFRNVVFRKEGIYKLEVYLDGDLLGDTEIPVIGGEKQ